MNELRHLASLKFPAPMMDAFVTRVVVLAELGGGGSLFVHLHAGHHPTNPRRTHEQLRDPQDPA